MCIHSQLFYTSFIHLKLFGSQSVRADVLSALVFPPIVHCYMFLFSMSVLFVQLDRYEAFKLVVGHYHNFDNTMIGY
jgi:hypothetical protein